jgi:glutamate-1-semialdehyde 2,1-aminomutase
MTHFVKDEIHEISNAEDAARCDSELLHRYHFEMMSKDGIFFLPGKLGAISNSHSQSDVKSMIDASNRDYSVWKQFSFCANHLHI